MSGLSRYIYISILALSIGANIYLGIRTALFQQSLSSQASNEALRKLEKSRSEQIQQEGKSDDSELAPSAVGELPPAGYANLYLKDIRLYWTDSIYADVSRATALLKSLRTDGLVDFDAPDQLEIFMESPSVSVNFSVMETIMNDRVFGHSNSHVRNMVIDSVESEGKRLLRIRGELELVAWLDFEMLAQVKVSEEPGIIEVNALKITSLGLPFVKGLMGTVGMQLDSLIVPDQSSGVTVKGNQIRIRLEKFFPPPAVHGKLGTIGIGEDSLNISLKGESAPANLATLLPDPSAPHYLFFAGRFVKFGPLRLIASSLQMIDRTVEDRFHFHVRKYFRQLDQSTARVMLDGRVKVFLVDFGKEFSDIPEKNSKARQ